MIINQIFYLSKMHTILDDFNIVQYYMNYDINLNKYLGKNIILEYLLEIRCIYCGTIINKSYNNGYCFLCLKTLACCDICIFKPELCHYHNNTCRDPIWAKSHCFSDHCIYLSNTSHVKVGITRKSNLLTRWIDQGSVQALIILEVRNRLLSGLFESTFKKYVLDKTYWKKMLQGIPKICDLKYYQKQLFFKIHNFFDFIFNKYGDDSYKKIYSNEQCIHYPVLKYLTHFKSFNLDKTCYIAGVLLGIKGQYIILDKGVINVKKFSGYLCRVAII